MKPLGYLSNLVVGPERVSLQQAQFILFPQSYTIGSQPPSGGLFIIWVRSSSPITHRGLASDLGSSLVDPESGFRPLDN